MDFAQSMDSKRRRLELFNICLNVQTRHSLCLDFCTCLWLLKEALATTGTACSACKRSGPRTHSHTSRV